jgi:hypothetical protein
VAYCGFTPTPHEFFGLTGFTTNFIWCVILHIQNQPGGEYFGFGDTTVRPSAA